jgi:hypothetical protein
MRDLLTRARETVKSYPEVGNIVFSIASTECGEIPSSTSPGISGDDTVSTCSSST